MADSEDTLEGRVEQNELNILDLQQRVDILEFKVFKKVITTDSLTTSGYQIIICKNTSPITITLELSPEDETEVHVKRRGAEVTIIGTIDGLVDRVLNIPQWSDHLVYDNTEWNVI